MRPPLACWRLAASCSIPQQVLHVHVMHLASSLRQVQVLAGLFVDYLLSLPSTSAPVALSCSELPAEQAGPLLAEVGSAPAPALSLTHFGGSAQAPEVRAVRGLCC